MSHLFKLVSRMLVFVYSGGYLYLNSSSVTPSDAVITDDVPQYTECGRSRENPLVKLGVVSSDLADVLIEPPSTTK